MYELKKMEMYLRVNLLGPGPRLMKKEFTGPRSHKGWETLIQTRLNILDLTIKTPTRQSRWDYVFVSVS